MIRISPVYVWINGSTKHAISDVASAARFLVYDWPEAAADHPLRRIAQQEALRLLENGGRPVAFENLFASALAAADVLAYDGEREAPAKKRKRR